MGKKTAAGLLGTLITAGVAVGVAKYLRDYAGVRFTDDEQIDKVKSDSSAVKEAAKRTYIAIKEKSNFREAATELSKAAGSVMTDAADIAKTAGSGTMQAFKDMKTKYDEDPDAFKSEFSDNISDMTQNIVKATQDKTEEFVDRIKSAYNDFDVYEVDGADEDAKACETAGDSDAPAASDGENDGGDDADDKASEAVNDTVESLDAEADVDEANNVKLSEDASAGRKEPLGEAGAPEAGHAEAAGYTAAAHTEAEPHKAPEQETVHDDGSFKLNFVDDDDDKSAGSNVTITDDES